MPAYTRNMNQICTYWAKSGVDVYGKPTYAAPVTLACRWEDKSELVRTPDGREVVSSSIVYPAGELVVGSWLALGDQTSTATPAEYGDAHEIIARGKSPDLRATTILYKAWL